MITRYYFIHIEAHQNGTVTKFSHVFTRKSWFPEVEVAYNAAIDKIVSDRKIDLEDLITVSFNRC